MSAAPCDSHGMRLKPEALRVGERHISEITELSIRDAGDWSDALSSRLTDKQNEIATRILKEINERSAFSTMWGPSYLHYWHAIPARSPAARAMRTCPPAIARPDRRALRPRRAPPSACTSATMTGCWQRWYGCATSATR
ncbi:MAG: hypothetical protein R3D03_07535 [Geminicoccaceae bacterium]